MLWKPHGGRRIIRRVGEHGKIQIELRTSPSPRIPPLLKRHLLHLAPVAFAFLIPFLPRTWAPWVMAAIFAAFIPFNFFLLERLPFLGNVFRIGESYLNNGIRLYPVAVCLAYVLFHKNPFVATTGFVVMAVGDAFSGIVGGFLGKRKLPWNQAKTVEGLVAFFVTAWGAATCFLYLHGAEGLETWVACAQVALVASAAGALAESVYLRLDDNLTVTAAACVAGWLAAAYFLRAAQQGLGPYNLVIAVGLNAAVAGAGYLLGVLTAGATAAAFAIGGGIYGSLGGRGYAVLAVYFVILALLRAFDRKRTPRLDALAASALIVPLAAAWAHFVSGDGLYLAAYAGALAALAAGTGGRVLPRVMGERPGTPVLAALLSSILIALAGWGLGMGLTFAGACSAAAGGFIASFLARLRMKRPWGSVAPALVGAGLAGGLHWLLVAVM